MDEILFAAKKPTTCAEAGRKGGRKTLTAHGPEFFSRIGKKGGKRSGKVRAAKARRTKP